MNKNRKALAIEALAHGQSAEQASKVSQVSRACIYKWLNDEGFQVALRERHSEIMQALSKRLVSITGKALEVLEESLYSRKEEIRLRASSIALSSLKNIIEITDFEERLSKLERTK